jgi:benzylsuccinate CoA-transferase BbsF subunit
MQENVFEGIKIVEFSWAVTGPTASKYLADHGATVVKVESHLRLDTNRSTSPFANNRPTPDSSVYFARHTSNKYSVTLNLQHPNGRALALKLIAWADIATESFSPGVMEKWELDYASACKVKPDIIYLSTSMQGRGGPHTNYAGYGQNAVNLCGFTAVTGWPDRKPAAPYGAYTDYICPRFDALALIAALDCHRRTGRGQWIEQSQFESAIHFFSTPIMDYQVNGRIMGRNGNRASNASPHGIFPCQGDDYWIAIAVLNEEQWQNICRAMGNTALAARPEFASLAERKKNEDELEKIIADWAQQHTAPEAEAILQEAGVPSNMVEKNSDVYADPQLEHRQYFKPLDHPVMGVQQYELLPAFILSETPRQIRLRAPCLGEHNEYVFKELLKLSDEEIAEHIIDGSITTELPNTFKAIM